MSDSENRSAAESRFAQPPSTIDTVISGAIEAFWCAFMVWIMGGIAVSIAGGFAGNMVPSLPPGFAHPQLGQYHEWWHTLKGDTFAIFYAIFFVHSLWVGFHGKRAGVGKRLERILSRLREHWFGLIVGNAIGAWVAVLVLEILPNFSLSQMAWHWVWGLLQPYVHGIGSVLIGKSFAGGLREWFSWYGDNQKKLTFWFFYLAGAFDDLGVPNFKTLARWTWRRMQKRKSVLSPVSMGGAEMM